MSEKSSSLHDPETKHIENTRNPAHKDNHDLNILETQPPNSHDLLESKRLVRKIDFRLLPVLACIYSFALIDRVNLPNARIAGMDEDLQLSVGNRYTLITMIFFVPYVIFQFPANIAIRKLGACLWLSSLVCAWGIVCIGMGFNQNWTETLGCRILLGVLEAG